MGLILAELRLILANAKVIQGISSLASDFTVYTESAVSASSVNLLLNVLNCDILKRSSLWVVVRYIGLGY